MGERCKKAKLAQAYILTSPLGHVYINACPDGVHCVKLYGDTSYDNIKWKGKVDFIRSSSFLAKNQHVIEVKKWLQQYFTNPIDCKGMPITFCGLEEYGEFNSKVWMTIFDHCPPGELLSYAELATQSGYGPGASKVVGYAINKNPYMLVVGDHRIVRASGEIWCENDSQRNKLRKALTLYEISFTDGSLDDALNIVRERNEKSKGSRKRASTATNGAAKRSRASATGPKRVKKEQLEDDDEDTEEEKPKRKSTQTRHRAITAKPGQKKKPAARQKVVKKEETSEEESELEEEDTTEDDD